MNDEVMQFAAAWIELEDSMLSKNNSEEKCQVPNDLTYVVCRITGPGNAR